MKLQIFKTKCEKNEAAIVKSELEKQHKLVIDSLKESGCISIKEYEFKHTHIWGLIIDKPDIWSEWRGEVMNKENEIRYLRIGLNKSGINYLWSFEKKTEIHAKQSGYL